MCPFPFSPDVTDTAMRNAREHVRQYYPTEIYDEQAFLGRCQIDLENVRELTREQLMNRGTGGVLQSGIYLIVAENGLSVYVGLANEFYSRFNSGRTAHTAQCPQDCRHHGHFANPTEGSSRVGMPDGNCRFFIVENIEHQGFGISQAEIDWYYLFLANGWIMRNAVGGEQRITNFHPSLGVKGREAHPCIVLDIESGNHMFFVGQNNAAESLGVLQAHLNSSIRHFQTQQGGYTARNASAEEALAGHVIGERDVIWTRGENGPVINDMREACEGCAGTSERHNMRAFWLTWNGGQLSELDILHLRGTMQGTYEIPTITTELNGISWLKSRTDDDFQERWQIRARRSSDSKDLFQTNRKEWTEANLLQAAIFREEKIRSEGWTDYNTGKYDSNADWINEQLGREEYTPW